MRTYFFNFISFLFFRKKKGNGNNQRTATAVDQVMSDTFTVTIKARRFLQLKKRESFQNIPEGRAHGPVAAPLRERLVGRFAVRFHHPDRPGHRFFVRANMPSSYRIG